MIAAEGGGLDENDAARTSPTNRHTKLQTLSPKIDLEIKHDKNKIYASLANFCRVSTVTDYRI